MTRPPYLRCDCGHPLHAAVPCVCVGDPDADECVCDDTGWVWWDGDPPVRCPECGELSEISIDGDMAVVRMTDEEEVK